MAEELKPCASCGGESQMAEGFAVLEVWPHGTFYRAYCTVCQLRQLFYRTEAEAIAAWNRRAAPEPAAPTVVEPAGKRMTVEELARTDGRFPFVWWREVPPGSLLYLAAPPRTPLTDAEIRKIAVEQASSSFGPADNDDETIDWIFNREDLLIFARAVIAASEGERK